MSPHRTRRRTLQALAAALAGAGVGCSELRDDPKVDDWQYDPEETTEDAAIQAAQAGGDGGSVGLAAGGGKDVTVFRRNVNEGYLPHPAALPYEGLFYDYYFDTGSAAGECTDLFCPTYSTAVSADPLSGAAEQYLSVGLDSGLSADEFERKTLNLVVVLDISGSMSAGFGQYYYDDTGRRREIEDGDRPKMRVATDAVAAMTTHLRAEDRLGVVLFDDEAHLAKPLRKVGRTDMDAIRDHLSEVEPAGGTNISAGVDEAEGMLESYEGADPTVYENRTLLLTDAMPNVGTTGNGGLQDRFADLADRGLYTTVVGVGIDANTDVVDAITAVKGANYYGVDSPSQFERRLDDEFEYMVTPLAFDVSLTVEGDGYEMRNVYGTTAADVSTGEVLSIRTLFPSPAEDGRVRGGVVLAELADTGSGRTVEVTAEWTERDGTTRETSETVRVDPGEERFGSTGVRKALVLTRYATLLKNWARYERGLIDGPPAAGIAVPPGVEETAPREQRSEELRVTPPYPDRIRSFREHFRTEADALGDEDLGRELELMETILAAESAAGTTTGADATAAGDRVALGVGTPTAWR